MDLTVSIDDQIVERARAIAQEKGITLDDLISECLGSLEGEDHRGEEVAREMRKFWSEGGGHSGGWKWNREELYDEILAERVKLKK